MLNDLLAGLCLASCVAVLVAMWMLAGERADRRRARYLDRLEREQTGEAEPQREERT